MKNKNIIKALAIGISASMALQPVTVLAEADVQTTPDGDAAQTQGSEQKQSANQESFDIAENSVDEAQNAAIAEHKENVADSAKVETEDYKNAVNAMVPENSTSLVDANTSLDFAIGKLSEEGAALGDAEQAVEDAKTADKNVEDKITEYNDNMKEANDTLSIGVIKDKDGNTYDQPHQVGEAGDAKKDADGATQDYSDIETAAENVSTAMGNTQTAVDNYVSSGAANDVDGSALKAIQDQYNNAKAVLDGLDEKLVDANDKLDKATTEYNDAKEAYDIAKAAYDKAEAAYNALQDLEDATDAQIAEAKKNLAKAQAKLDKEVLTVEEAKTVYEEAETAADGAKQDLEAAKTVVDSTLAQMQNVQMQEIIDLQKRIETPKEDDDVEVLKKDLQKMFIAYYLLGKEKITDVNFADSTEYTIPVAKDILGNDIVDTEGNKYYVSGYSNGLATYVKIPTATSVTYKDKDGKDVTVLYSITVNNGIFTVYQQDGTAETKTATLEDAIPEHYVDSTGATVTIPTELPDTAKVVNNDTGAVKLVDESNIIEGNIKEGLGTALNEETITKSEDRDYVYVGSSEPESVTDENGVITQTVTNTYTKTKVTETTEKTDSTSDYEHGTRDYKTVTQKEEFESTEKGYRQWLAAIEEHKNDNDFQAQFYDYEIQWWGPFPVGITGGMKDIKDKSGWDDLSYHFDIVLSWIGIKPFTISYTTVTEEETTESKEGFLKTVTDNYKITENTEVSTYTETVTTTKTPVYRDEIVSTEVGDAAFVSGSEYKGTEHTIKGYADAETANSDMNEWVNFYNSSSYWNWVGTKTTSAPKTEGNVTTTTSTWTEGKVEGRVDPYTETVESWVLKNGGWQRKKVDVTRYKVVYYYVERDYKQTTTTTTAQVIDHYDEKTVTSAKKLVDTETKKTGESTTGVVSSKTFYGTKEYTYVPTQDAKTGEYYQLKQATVWGSSSSNEYQQAIINQNNASQKLIDAQTAYNTALDAYNNAQTKLTAAKNAVAALESSKATKKSLVDAQQKLQNAKLALGTAETNLGDAETALNEAKAAKENAETAVANAKQAAENAQPALVRASNAKNAADRDRANQQTDDNGTTGGTSSDASDDTSDDTTTTPVAISTVAANTQTGEAVLGENRTPASRAAAASARSNGSNVASTASTNNTNNSSNSAVAGDTNSNATEKETDAVDTTTTIEDEETAKAATPIETQKSFPYWVLIILAAIAGVSVEEYVRRRNEKVKADDSKKN